MVELVLLSEGVVAEEVELGCVAVFEVGCETQRSGQHGQQQQQTNHVMFVCIINSC